MFLQVTHEVLARSDDNVTPGFFVKNVRKGKNMVYSITLPAVVGLLILDIQLPQIVIVILTAIYSVVASALGYTAVNAVVSK